MDAETKERLLRAIKETCQDYHGMASYFDNKCENFFKSRAEEIARYLEKKNTEDERIE